MITSKIGNRIRELRKKEGISQEKLAFKADLDRTY
ncbi:helix-turn-helix domain-containing protein, partial [Streptococcus timonensis]